MPTPRKRAATLRLTGDFAHNPSRIREDLKGRGSIGAWRPGSDDPAKVWDELVRAAPPGILTGSDRIAVELCARTVAEVRKTGKALSVTALGNLLQTLGRIGLTPAGRHALDAPTVPPISAREKIERDKKFSEFKVAGRDD